MTLFRPEVLEAQKQKLHGDVFLTSPVSFKVVTVVLGALCALVLVILFVGSYARTERVPGYLVPSGGLVKIQAGRFGSLMEIHVGEGDVIQKGDPLISVEAGQPTADETSVEFQSLQTLVEQRLNLQNQIALEQRQLWFETERIQAEITSINRSIPSLETQLRLQREITSSAKFSFDGMQGLLDDGLMSKTNFEERHRTWLEEQTDEELREQALEDAKANLIQLGFQLEQLPSLTESRLAILQAQLLDIDTREAELNGREAYVVKAPVAGRVASITSGTVGQSILPEQPILSIFPKDSQLVAELFVPSRAIGFVRKGQEARLLYAAFPYQRFGSYPAKIIDVTETVLSPGEAETPFDLQEPSYRVTAALERENLDIGDDSVALQSGMQLEANIIQERRSFLGWLLQPLRAVGGRS